MNTIVNQDIDTAIALLKKGEVVAIPTETVYGLAASINKKNAIEKIFKLKERPKNNPLIVHVHSIDAWEKLVVSIPKKARLLAETFWPGPITIILPKGESVSSVVTGNQDTVAVRIPNHPFTLEVLKRGDLALAAPSANPFTRISPTSANRVFQYFDGKIPMILDGGSCTSGIESTIIGFKNETPIVYRLGSLSLNKIEALIGKVTLSNNLESIKVMTPGMFKKHYAPETKTIFTSRIEEMLSVYQNKKVGLLMFSKRLDSEFPQIILSEKGDFKEAAAHLYEALQQLDEMNLDIILAQEVPQIDLGLAINDRLQRATTT